MRWVDPSEFESLLEEEPTIIDCQPNVHDYIRQHIAGAVYLNEESLRLNMRGRPHVWIPSEVAQVFLRQLGIRNGRPVAIYGSRGSGSTGDGMAQMVLAYSLFRYGHGDITILDGGLERWMDGLLPVTRSPTKGDNGDFRASARRNLTLSVGALERALEEGNSLLIDTRLPELYQGESGFPKPGHIPGAVNLPWTELVMPNNPCRLRDTSSLRACLNNVKAIKTKKVIIYCATGRKSAALFNIMRFIFGIRGVRLYEGSFTEWCADAGRRTVTGKNPY